MSKATTICERKISRCLWQTAMGIFLMAISVSVSAFISPPGKGFYAAGLSWFCQYDDEDLEIICSGGKVIDGSLVGEQEAGASASGYWNTSLGAVVYEGAIYVFFTTYDGKLQYGKMSLTGGLGSTHTIATGVSPRGAAAAVLHDVIYVFTASQTFTSSDGVNFAVSAAGSPPQSMSMVDAVSYFPLGDVSAGILVVYQDSKSRLRSSLFSGNAFSAPQTLPLPSSPFGDSPFSAGVRMGNLVLGTSTWVWNGAKAPCIQLFALANGGFDTSGNSPWRRWEYNVATNAWTTPEHIPYPYSQQLLSSLVIAPWFEAIDSTKGTLRLEHLLWGSIIPGRVVFNSSTSDYLIPQYADNNWAGVYTPTNSNSDPDKAATLRNLWSLVGIVLGPPPFALNGASDASGLSDVQYGISKQQTVTTSNTFSQTISVGSETTISGGLGEANLDLSYAHGWSSSHSKSSSVNVSTTYTFGPVGETPPDQGIHGWALFNAPTLVTQRFKIYAYDASTYLGQDMYTTSTAQALPDVEYFNLQRPADGSIQNLFVGMPPYPFSTDLATWHSRIPDWNPPDAAHADWKVIFGNVSDPAVDQLKQTGPVNTQYTTSNSVADTSTNSNKFSVEAGATFDILEGFSEGIKIGYDAEFENSTEVSTTITTDVSMDLNMRIPANPGDVANLTIQPFWLQATSADAPWVPSGYSGNLPWAITWNVISYDIFGQGTLGLAPHPLSSRGIIGTGKGQKDSYKIDAGFMAWEDAEGVRTPPPLSAGDFNPAKGATVSLNGHVFSARNNLDGRWRRQGDRWKYRTILLGNAYPFTLELDFANHRWFFETTSRQLEKIFPIADNQVGVQLSLQGIYRFTHWLPHHVNSAWLQRLDKTEWKPYGVRFIKGAYDTLSDVGYTVLKGHIPVNERHFGDVELLINNSAVSIPLLRTKGFLRRLKNRGQVTYKTHGLSFNLDFGNGRWEAYIEDSWFNGKMAPKKGAVRVQMRVGGEQVSDQTLKIENYSEVLRSSG
ncbi:MAG: hypothetical protein ACU837_16205 [Gammaproteobacteria bacterium]